MSSMTKRADALVFALIWALYMVSSAIGIGVVIGVFLVGVWVVLDHWLR